MDLPDFPDITPAVLAALAAHHHVPAYSIVPMPDIGITNKLFRFGDHLVLRIPRNHPVITALARKEARVVPAMRALGVQTPELVVFDDACDILPVPYALYTYLDGATLELLDLEPEATPDVWRALGRDLARVHAGSTPTMLPPGEIGVCEEIITDPHALVREGYFTATEARWFDAMFDRLAPAVAAPVAPTFLHGDSQATNILVRPISRTYLAVLDWGSSGWGDAAWDFAGIPLRAVPFMLEGHRQLAPLPDDANAEARILWRHLHVGLWQLQRGPQPGLSWAERPLPWLLDTLRFLQHPPPRWRDLV
jgi:aminoglycoside phosphotransferase (APT) family kinase protein